MMENWISTTPPSVYSIVLSCLFIYIATIFFSRIFGKRSFSKMSNFDFAMTITVGSIIATTTLNSSVSISEGLIALFTIFFLQFIAAFSRRFKPFKKVIDNDPLLLMVGENILYDNLKKARVTEDDLRSKIRKENVLDLSDIKAVIFETTGDLVVLHSKDKSATIEKWLMEDVNKE